MPKIFKNVFGRLTSEIKKIISKIDKALYHDEKFEEHKELVVAALYSRSTHGGVVQMDFPPSKGWLSQIFVFADVDLRVKKYQTKKYQPVASFCT